MTSRRRDRHQRGLRGPLALENAWTALPARIRRPSSNTEFFAEAMGAALDRVSRQCPEALEGVSVGFEDVPHLETAWSADQVPLAAALEATPERPSQLIIYRRPLEHRAATRRGLSILVYRTMVEQLSALTGRSVSEIDPDDARDAEDPE